MCELNIMSTRFFTNHGEQTLFKKFQGVFESNPDIEKFDALVGFLRASGYFAVRPFLTHVDQVRILVGINVDQIMADYHRRGLLFLADAGKTLEKFRSDLRGDIQGAAYRKDVEAGILQFVDDVISRKVVIRAHPSKRLHAKIYIFRPRGFNEHKPGAVITGSSNLTEAGLGADEINRNYEFNVLLHDYDDVTFAVSEFDRLWKESVDVLPADIAKVHEHSYLGVKLTPHELYFKLLLEYFGSAIDYDPNAITDLPEKFKRLTYQIDAVAQGYRLLEKHGGFFLADVVGLGKTIIAILIAKKFFFRNGFPDHRSHTLIVVPPALEDTWQETIDLFRLDNVKIITNGSLHKLRSVEKYDLVIVDEAHKFRNDTAEAFDELQRICKTPTNRLLADGTRTRKKVILVSATPLNNRPGDIRNLIALFQDLKDSTLSVSNLQHFFAQRDKEYRQAHNEPDVRLARLQVKAIYEQIRTKVISEVIVRRTRTDLLANDEYTKDLEAQHVNFPRVEPPRPLYYPLPSDMEELYDRTVTLISHPDEKIGLTYNRYRAISFLRADKKIKYKNADRISIQLASIMRTMLVKRIDSSFHAFRQSLHRFLEASQTMLQTFERGTIYIAPNLNVTEYLVEGREDELIEKIAERQPTDPTIEICKPEDFREGFVEGLRHDVERLTSLVHAWDAVTIDPKLDKFLEALKTELFDPKIQGKDHKLVVFSESKETTDYLQERLNAAGYNRILIVDSSTRKDRMPLVKANFDANAEKQTHDFDILISTEVLAEGVNLHRANVIVNYDTPWNSTRLMQRIGRVNRIGTLASRIYIYNFYPTAKVDDDIELKKKAIMKLQAFHSALGEDSQIYSTEEEVDTFGLFERSPEDDERDERLTLLMELRKFRQQHPELFRRIQNLPLRARAGRADAGRAGSTATFIRSNRRDAFYRVAADGGMEEITIVEAAREFRAPDPKEKSVPLHAAHYDHVNAAIKSFQDKAAALAVEADTVNPAQGPNERRALAYLDGFLAFSFVSDREKELIKAAKQAIHKARFQQLQRQINQLQRSAKGANLTQVAVTDKLMEIIRAYPLEAAITTAETPLLPLIQESTPDIILSESFTTS